MSGLEQLLALQEIDTGLDQLHHRRRSLPERAALADIDARRRAMVAEHEDARARRDEVANRQASLENDIATSENRIRQIDQRMYSGEVTASRDLQAMTDEINSLKARVSGLEDAALAVMDEREPLDAEVEALDAQAADLERKADDLRQAIKAAEANIDADAAAERARRDEAAAAIPPDLLTTYERLRTRLGGIGAARLEHGTCMGCHLRLPATELDRLKREPPDAVVFCDQCGRILVR